MKHQRNVARAGEFAAIVYRHKNRMREIDAQERRVRWLLRMVAFVSVFGPTIAFLF